MFIGQEKRDFHLPWWGKPPFVWVSHTLVSGTPRPLKSSREMSTSCRGAPVPMVVAQSRVPRHQSLNPPATMDES